MLHVELLEFRTGCSSLHALERLNHCRGSRGGEKAHVVHAGTSHSGNKSQQRLSAGVAQDTSLVQLGPIVLDLVGLGVGLEGSGGRLVA